MDQRPPPLARHQPSGAPCCSVNYFLQSDITTTSPPTSIHQGTPGAPISPTTSAVSTAVTGGVQITSNIQFDS